MLLLFGWLFLACFPYYIGFLRWGLTGYALRLCLNIILFLNVLTQKELSVAMSLMSLLMMNFTKLQ
ncbi:hypothetical protein EA184_20605 [Escherichia coli]|nr:hypothetical protein CJU63_15145 [Escherichia coli]EZE05326.1 hypothetical protein BX09_24690 [Escherichia coli O145:H28 str. 2009C-3292]KDV27879.1 hypothetical protein BU56_27560 [Escherichia coli O145:H25 str. 07-3858]ATX15881.1 hypothetical protein CU077_18330 [Escherichia coli]EEV5591646.1 hypothetical protein [Escherichia coli]